MLEVGQDRQQQGDDVHHGDGDAAHVEVPNDTNEKVGQCSEQAIKDLGE